MNIYAVAIKLSYRQLWLHIKNWDADARARGDSQGYELAEIDETGDTFSEAEAHGIAEELNGRAVKLD